MAALAEMQRTTVTWLPSETFDWNDKAKVTDQIWAACRDFAALVSDRPWLVLWCARSSVLDTQNPELEHETKPLESLVKILTSHRPVTMAAILAEARRALKLPRQHHHHRTSRRRTSFKRSPRSSIVWPYLDQRSLTPWSEGIRAVVDELVTAISKGISSATIDPTSKCSCT